MKGLAVCSFFAALAFSSLPACADPEECREAIDSYNSAKSDISDALRWYTDCLSGSSGHDDCSSEFWKMKSAQDELESAVSSYQSDCD